MSFRAESRVLLPGWRREISNELFLAETLLYIELRLKRFYLNIAEEYMPKYCLTPLIFFKRKRSPEN